jgi:hypothetical protein
MTIKFKEYKAELTYSNNTDGSLDEIKITLPVKTVNAVLLAQTILKNTPSFHSINVTCAATMEDEQVEELNAAMGCWDVEYISVHAHGCYWFIQGKYDSATQLEYCIEGFK